MLTLFFGQHGYEVLAVSSSQVALFLLPDESFDLYILGPQLSRTDCITFCRKIRQFERYAPILIYSDANRRFEQEAALYDGKNVIVVKPSIDKLLETVRAELEF
jgi:DNA-binding response OmpR family regulator